MALVYEHIGIAAPYWLGALAVALAALVMLGASGRPPAAPRLEAREQVALG